MKKLLTVICVLIAASVTAQKYQNPLYFGFQARLIKGDTSLGFLLNDTTFHPAPLDTTYVWFAARAQDTSLYYWIRGSWKKVGTGSGSGGVAGNPTGVIGLTPNNGVATTYMRSDATPVLDTSVFSTVGGTIAKINALSASVVQLSGTYDDPPWLTHLSRMKIVWGGLASNYIDGTGALRVFPTDLGSFSNSTGYIKTITGFISNTGTNTTIGGSGTLADPYVINSTAGGLSNPMTTLGDQIVGSSGGSPIRVGPGSNGQFWSMVTGSPGWTNTFTVAPQYSGFNGQLVSASLPPKTYVDSVASADTVATIAQLESYSRKATATNILVTDSLRGGTFNYVPSGLTPDSGTIFNAWGRGSGYWMRSFQRANGINAQWFGLITDTTNPQSAYRAIQMALNYGTDIYFPSRCYIKLDSAVVIDRSGTHIHATKTTTFRINNDKPGNFTSGAFKTFNLGAKYTDASPTINLKGGSNWFIYSGYTHVQVGDMALIEGPVYASFSGRNYNYGVTGAVQRVSGDTVFLDVAADTTFSATGLITYTSLNDISFEGGIFDMSGNVQGIAMQLYASTNVNVKGVRIKGKHSAVGVLLNYCDNATVTDCNIDSCSDGGANTAYGIAVNGNNITVSGNSVINSKHCITMPGGFYFSTGIVFRSNIIAINDTSISGAPMDMHGGARHCTMDGNTIFNLNGSSFGQSEYRREVWGLTSQETTSA